MFESVKYNLRHLTDGSGRDGRPTFWFYVLFLVVIQFAIGILSSIPLYVSMFQQMMDAVTAGGSEPDAVVLAAAMGESMKGFMQVQVWISAIVTVAIAGLLYASFIRRLHDGGFTGLIALIPVATSVFAAIYSVITLDDIIAVMDEMLDPANSADAMALQAEAAPYSWVGWIGYIVVIGFGVLKSQDGANRFGPEPE